MKATIVILRKAVPILTVALLLLGHAAPVHAMPCFTGLTTCYQDAASISSFWTRVTAGLDCELSFVSCARESLVGY